MSNCHSKPSKFSQEDKLIRYQQQMDSIGSKKIDSVYKQVRNECDTAMKYKLPVMIDSLLRADSIRNGAATHH